ncbi:12217_t:CDS:2, partial [Racocetra persica]
GSDLAQEAPKVCYYCKQTGHIKKDCKDLKSQDESKTQMQFSPENPYVSEIVLENTDKSSTEIQEIFQPVTETTMAETIQTGEFNPTEAMAETNEMETTENEPEATNISTNNDLENIKTRPRKEAIFHLLESTKWTR